MHCPPLINVTSMVGFLKHATVASTTYLQVLNEWHLKRFSEQIYVGYTHQGILQEHDKNDQLLYSIDYIYGISGSH